MNDNVRTALVTGASGGIGRSIAQTLASVGWNVILSSRSQAGLEETAEMIRSVGGVADVRPLDIANGAAVDALQDALADEGIRVDALVNNSGIGGVSKPMWEVTDQEWDECMDINVRGVFLMCRAFLPQMIERNSGNIVNIGSITGKNPLKHRTPYASSKAALIGFTKTLAADAGEYGVRVNLISPGGVSGDRLDWVVKAQAEATGKSEDDVRAAASASAALRRFTTPDEVAAAVAFLISDEASGITGVDLTVAAGFVMN